MSAPEGLIQSGCQNELKSQLPGDFNVFPGLHGVRPTFHPLPGDDDAKGRGDLFCLDSENS